MSESKYEFKGTPGPWCVFTPDDYEGPESIPGLGVESEATGESVVWYATQPEEGIQNDTDAQLIAAAPELFEALKGALQAMNDADAVYGEDALYDAARAAEKALAKATGEQQ